MWIKQTLIYLKPIRTPSVSLTHTQILLNACYQLQFIRRSYQRITFPIVLFETWQNKIPQAREQRYQTCTHRDTHTRTQMHRGIVKEVYEGSPLHKLEQFRSATRSNRTATKKEYWVFRRMWHECLRSFCVLSQYIFIQALRRVCTKAENSFSGLGGPNVILEELAMLKNPYQLTKNLNVDQCITVKLLWCL